MDSSCSFAVFSAVSYRRRSAAWSERPNATATFAAKFCSSWEKLRIGPMCSLQSTPTSLPRLRIGASSIEVIPSGSR